MLYFCYKADDKIYKAISQSDLTLAKKLNPKAAAIFETLREDLCLLNAISYTLRKDYKIPLYFYTEYQLAFGLYEKLESMMLSNQVLPSKLSFSIETKSRAILVSFLEDDLLHIPSKIQKKTFDILGSSALAKLKTEFITLDDKSFDKSCLAALTFKIASFNEKLDGLYFKNKNAVLAYERISLADTKKLTMTSLV